MNIHKEPLDIRASLSNAFRSVALGFLQPQHHEDEELGNPYAYIHEEEVAFQEAYDERARRSFGGVGSLAQGLWRSEPPGPAGPAGWFSGREARPEKVSLIRSLTPSFLRRNEDDDFASACCPHLGFKQRLFGCACCFCLGQLMQFCSFGAVTGVLLGHPSRFACLYTMGNITMMAASFFLSGPQAQCRKIKAKGRARASLVYFSSMLLTLTAVFSQAFFGRAFFILLCVLVQWLALVWYVLSYVPYGHTVGRRVIRTLCACVFRL